MKKSLLAGAALVAGIAVAAPMLASSAETQTPPAAAAPSPPATGGTGDMQRGTMPGMPGGMSGMMGGMRGMMGGRDEMGPMGHHGWRHEGMMRGAMRMTPQQRCDEHLARRAGVIAYTVAKLNLSAEQRPLWDKVQTLLQTAQEKQRQLCDTLKPEGERGQQTILDRLDRHEKFLAGRLQALQQIRPALQQFYQALTPAQQTIINHPFRPA
jgi:LTXXQ motif family protein